MRQTDAAWRLKDIYRGLGMQTMRTTGMLMFIFGPYDVIRQKRPELMSNLFRQWATTTMICGASYLVVWPLETLKNLGQAALPRAGAGVAERVKHLGGFAGLYRGSGPGIIGGGFRNGMAMVAMANWQKLATQLGLRN